ncbi:hypothetical protein GY45DRAFT_1281309 [Cubamyces sp. BRFM 1775]|nr:hypothetical protein GY45DRAFT_1281309 [Cubamyces sp. BRFM 1775]
MATNGSPQGEGPRAHATFNYPTADIIICSSDNIHFRLHRNILSIASDFFGDMLSLPQPDGASGLPVIPVTEPSTVLECLFRLCYPIKDPPLLTVEQVRPTLEAAMKYQMGEATEIATAKLHALVSVAPLRVYAIAYQRSLDDVVRSAGQVVHKQNAQNTYVDELEEIPVSAYRRLLSYCERAGPWNPLFGGTTLSQQFGLWLEPTTQILASVPPPIIPPFPGQPAKIIVSPTFDPSNADLIIHTSDNVRLGVSQDILKLSSPVFAKELSKGGQTPRQTLLPVPESGKVMLALLHICYPIPSPSFATLDEIVNVLIAAEKYQMSKATWYLRGALAKLADSPSVDPLWLYLAACRFGMQELAGIAARSTLRQDLVVTSQSDIDLDKFGVSAGCFWRLLEYHRQCKAAVRGIVDGGDMAWISKEWHNRLKASCTRSSALATTCWLSHYLKAIAKEAWPRSSSAVSEKVLAEAMTGSASVGFAVNNPCSACTGRQGMLTIISFSKFVESVIEEREEKVILQWKKTALVV